MQFAGCIALGPFAVRLHHGGMPPAIPFAAAVLVMCSFYFVRPSAATLFVTLIGVAIWVGAGVVIVAALA